LATFVDNREKIAALEQVLASGQLSHTVDGVSITYRSRADLVAQLRILRLGDNTGAIKKPAPRVRTVYLGGF
jgi:hypothetical protein